MKASTKGTIFSGLVFPGVGQILLGRKMAGLVFIVATGFSILALIYSALMRIPVILEKLMPAMQQGTVNLAMIFEETHRVTASGSTLLDQISVLAILVCWLSSMIHAYLVGRKMDEYSGRVQEIS